MKHFKILGLLAVEAAALMALTGTALATTTSPAGTKYGGEIVASSSSFELDGALNVKCNNSVFKISLSKAGSTSGLVNAHSFTGCGNDTLFVNLTGSWSFAWPDVITSTGEEYTLILHRTILGFPVTAHCMYKTNNTAVGTITFFPPKIDENFQLPAVPTDGICGDSATVTGSSTITTPETLVVD